MVVNRRLRYSIAIPLPVSLARASAILYSRNHLKQTFTLALDMPVNFLHIAQKL